MGRLDVCVLIGINSQKNIDIENLQKTFFLKKLEIKKKEEQQSETTKVKAERVGRTWKKRDDSTNRRTRD